MKESMRHACATHREKGPSIPEIRTALASPVGKFFQRHQRSTHVVGLNVSIGGGHRRFRMEPGWWVSSPAAKC